MTEANPNSTAVATRKVSPAANLIAEVKKREADFANTLPTHVPPERFMRAMTSAIASSKDIAACTPTSVVVECLKAATDGLVIDGREAALVKFGNEAKYIPMVAGLMKMARNSGDISTISAVVVYSGDGFQYDHGVDDVPRISPDWFGNRGEPVGVYSVVRLKDGAAIVEVMSKAQVMKIAAGTKNGDQYDPTKGKSWGEWWRKCVLRRISKYLPRSTDKEGAFLEAVRRDDDLYDPNAAPSGDTPKPRKKRNAGAETLAAAPAGQEFDAARDLPPHLRRTATDETPVLPEAEEEQEDQGSHLTDDQDTLI